MENKIKLDQIKVLVTSECNLNCTHCFRSFDKHKYFIPNNKLIELVDYAIETSCDNISFSGGEFFMHPFAFELLDYCYLRKIKVKILTNATILGPLSFFEKYKNTDLISFQISLDGTRKNHDLRRGKGVFDKVITNVKKLKELGIHLTASMTIDKTNMHDILDVMDLPYFDNFNFLPVAYAGSAKNDGRPVFDEVYSEYEEIIKTIYKDGGAFLDENYRCRMFPYQLGVKYDGTVYPCAVARDYGIFCMGNLNDKPISQLIEDFCKTKEAQELFDYKNNSIDECNNCSAKNKCSRGCRARAFKYFGKLTAADPFCCKLLGKGYEDIPLNCLFWGER